jgi:hypothetical protein
LPSHCTNGRIERTLLILDRNALPCRENTFLHLKRGEALPPDTPKTGLLLAIIQIRRIALWLKVW